MEMSRENFPGVKEVACFTGETKMKVLKLNFLAMSQKQHAHANFFHAQSHFWYVGLHVYEANITVYADAILPAGT